MVLLTLVVLVAAGACSRKGPSDTLVLDGRPRLPDAEGVVVHVSRERIVLDGGRAYSVSPALRSFSTQTMATVPVLGRENQFVHLGLRGDTMVWIAIVGAVLPGDPPVIYYTGSLREVKGGRAYFADGTVLGLAPGVAAPVKSGFLQVSIDPKSHLVSALKLP